jgi:hypothetical protein
MIKFDGISMTKLTKKDTRAIRNFCHKEIELYINCYNKVWTEGGTYIADCRPIKKDEDGCYCY